MSDEKPLVWLHGEIKTPSFGQEARLKAGFLLRRLQQGDKLSMPLSRPMPSIGPGCFELRIEDRNKIWRIIHRIDDDAIIILEVLLKKTEQTPKRVINICKERLARYDQITSEE